MESHQFYLKLRDTVPLSQLMPQLKLMMSDLEVAAVSCKIGEYSGKLMGAEKDAFHPLLLSNHSRNGTHKCKCFLD